ncbi:hypothetical protein BV898_00168 [Hypsibius exemplaris]|uniref:Uncharacterized protein n=1 Tax=Hypsibius exemplaris TaxID=2072580 RepID=A0A1W0XF63_HYPEX|nr:hypothetical protein BV898_00168 [Hypsibius exemplaris]
MIFDLQIRAQLENVGQIIPSDADDFEWNVMFKCSGCGEERDTFRVLSLSDTSTGKSGKGEAHLVETCHFCGRANTVVIMEKSGAIPYLEADSGSFKTLCSLDCRGLEPTKFKLGGGFRVSASNSKTVFDDVALADEEWTEYDATAKESLSIMEVESRFVKRK